MADNGLEEELIEAVRMRPSLWDIGGQKYHDNGYRNILWEEIADQLSHHFKTPEAAHAKW